jgi:hypothetical protein
VPFRETKVKRIFEAFKLNIDGWSLAVAEIEQTAHPGNKLRCLHLMRSLEQAKRALEHLMADAAKD